MQTMTGQFDADAAHSKQRAEWRKAAYRAAFASRFAPELEQLEERIAAKKAEQRRIMDGAGFERRTLDIYEAKNFDVLQADIDTMQRRIDSIMHEVHPNPYR